MAALPFISMGLSAVGAGVTAMGTIAGGNAAAAAGQAARQAAEFRALQEEQAANESRALGQRSAMEQRREGRLLASTLQARAAAGGGSATDPGAIDLLGDVAGRSEYLGLMEIFKGENRARGLADSALATRYSGDAALAEGLARKQASRATALGTVIGSAGSMFSQFGRTMGAPASTPTVSSSLDDIQNAWSVGRR